MSKTLAEAVALIRHWTKIDTSAETKAEAYERCAGLIAPLAALEREKGGAETSELVDEILDSVEHHAGDPRDQRLLKLAADRITQLERELADEERETAHLGKRLEECRRELASANRHVSQIQESWRDCIQRKSKAERELAEARAENEAMRGAGLAQALQLEVTKDRLAEADAIIRADGEGDLEQYSELKARVAESHKSLGELAEKYNALHDKETALLEQNAALQKSYDHVSAMAGLAQSELRKAEARLAAVERWAHQYITPGSHLERTYRAALSAPAEPKASAWCPDDASPSNPNLRGKP